MPAYWFPLTTNFERGYFFGSVGSRLLDRH